MEIGPNKKNLRDKYMKMFSELSMLDKIKVILLTFIHSLVIELQHILYLSGLKKKTPLRESTEVDLRKFELSEKTRDLHLSEEDIQFFNDNGYVKPFKVISREEAFSLNKLLRERVMEGNVVYGPFPEMENEKRKQELKKLGVRDDLEARSWNRHFNIPEIMTLLSKDEISHRLESLFGKDVYLWRSQMFPLANGHQGTSLHQVTDFNFAMDKKVLRAEEGFPESLINLTVWIALDDVDNTNGALVMVKGSHHNNRFEQYVVNHEETFHTLSFRERLFLIFIRNISNDGDARFDRVKMLQYGIQRTDPDVLNHDKLVTINMKAGEALIFTSRTIHGSEPNSSGKERLAIAGRYTSSAVSVYPDSGDYREVNHFLPIKPVVLKKYRKKFKLTTVNEPAAAKKKQSDVENKELV